MVQVAHLIYFSPTGTTRKISERIAAGFGAKHVIHYDVTLPDASFETKLTDGVAIIGVPVYAGRIPELCLQRFQGFTSSGVPAVLLALYGNREFEDALVELRDLTAAQGFNVIAAGAFIGEHSYSTPEQPIAGGRPDAEDLQLARQFGQQIAEKLVLNVFDPLQIPGNVPYKERVKLGGIAPETDSAKCSLCGQCASVCPTGVVSVSDSVITDAAHCIMCCACVRACTTAARSFRHPQIEERRAMLLKNCSTPKTPVVFI